MCCGNEPQHTPTILIFLSCLLQAIVLSVSTIFILLSESILSIVSITVSVNLWVALVYGFKSSTHLCPVISAICSSYIPALYAMQTNVLLPQWLSRSALSVYTTSCLSKRNWMSFHWPRIFARWPSLLRCLLYLGLLMTGKAALFSNKYLLYLS